MRLPFHYRLTGSFAALAAAAALAIFVSSCGQSPVSPSKSALVSELTATGMESVVSTPSGAEIATGSGFYPLAAGNRWHYRQTMRIAVTGQPDLVSRGDLTFGQIGIESLSGRDYMVERQMARLANDADPVTSWIRYRQDRSGLYEADVPTSQPPAHGRSAIVASARAADPVRALGVGYIAHTFARSSDRAAYAAALDRALARLAAARSVSRPAATLAPNAGPLDQELTRLAYPLHVGARWLVRADPLLTAEVEGQDRLILPIGPLHGFRVRYAGDLFGPNDRLRVWFGHAGVLHTVFHIESVATDDNGHTIGMLTIDEQSVLDRAQIAGNRGGGVTHGPEASRPR